MCTPASDDMDSLLSAWDFSPSDSCEDEEEHEGFSGMKRATRKATTTVHAPRRKGGPGMRACWEGARGRERRGQVTDFHTHHLGCVTLHIATQHCYTTVSILRHLIHSNDAMQIFG